MNSVDEAIIKNITDIQKQNNRESIEISNTSNFTKDLGFTSLDVAQLIAQLEFHFDLDPFSEGASLNEIHTVQMLCEVYKEHLATVA